MVAKDAFEFPIGMSGVSPARDLDPHLKSVCRRAIYGGGRVARNHPGGWKSVRLSYCQWRATRKPLRRRCGGFAASRCNWAL